MDIQEMNQIREAQGLSFRQIADGAGGPSGTVYKVLSRSTAAPRYDTMRRLTAYFRKLSGQGQDEGTGWNLTEPEQRMSESAAAYAADKICPVPRVSLGQGRDDYGIPGKHQGEYTLEDYLALPDERRVELIDGWFYDMSAPTTVHQMIIGAVYRQLFDCITQKHKECRVMLSPTDVQLDCDDRTILQPDVLAICDRQRILRARIYGPPDFVVEVLSPFTAAKDRLVKTRKYMEAGVREYWLVNPDRLEITTYDFTQGTDAETWHFTDIVPVHISGGDCAVDFRSIYEEIAFLYEEDASEIPADRTVLQENSTETLTEPGTAQDKGEKETSMGKAMEATADKGDTEDGI